MNLDKLNSTDPKVKYGFAKELLEIAATTPALLYGDYDALIVLAKEKNNILKWTGIDLIGHLSSVDKEDKTDRYIPLLFKLLHGGHLITSNHAIFSLGHIAQNKPSYKDKIIAELIRVSHDSFDTEECRNIATGKVLDVFKQLMEDIKGNKSVLDFIQKATLNERNSTKQKAVRLLNVFEFEQRT